ncbi:helix-turn-helix domain-containing protein [Dongia sp.]|uniref:helix-turn-helix domain-containing protein n=1 Tax=Dongia sp. TaxID=1977262 RepID=UPI0037538439
MLAQNAIAMDRSAITAAAVLSRLPADSGSEDELAKGTVLHFEPNQEIYAEGDDAKVFYRVVSGVVRTCRFLSDGRRQIDAFYGEGEVFGFDLAEARSFGAEAVTDCTLHCYQQVKLTSDKQGAMAVPQQLFSYAMGRLAKAQEHAMVLSRRSALERVASFLVEWTKNSSRKDIVSLAMTRTDIGDYLGLTIETVSRSLSQLERQGHIALPTARQIEIKNVATLEELYA